MTRSGAATAKTRPYFPELDGVRAIAALMVMAFHFSQAWWQKGFMMFGQTGVDLFFVLSGFLITTILLQARPQDWHEVRNFYIRRTFRIFPLYYGYLAGAALFGAGVSAWYWFYGQNVAEALGYHLVGPDHFWSLAVEEQFYLVWPFLILFWPRRWLAAGMWLGFASLLILRFVTLHTAYSGLVLTLTRPDGLVAGGLLAYYFSKSLLSSARPWFVGMAVFAVAALGVQWRMTAGRGTEWAQATKFSLASILYVALIGLLLLTANTVLHRFLRWRAMRELGRVSYGMYVYHPMIFATLPRFMGTTPLVVKAVVCFVVSYAIAYASFYIFEKRFIDLKERFAHERKFREVTA